MEQAVLPRRPHQHRLRGIKADDEQLRHGGRAEGVGVRRVDRLGRGRARRRDDTQPSRGSDERLGRRHDGQEPRRARVCIDPGGCLSLQRAAGRQASGRGRLLRWDQRRCRGVELAGGAGVARQPPPHPGSLSIRRGAVRASARVRPVARHLQGLAHRPRQARCAREVGPAAAGRRRHRHNAEVPRRQLPLPGRAGGRCLACQP